MALGSVEELGLAVLFVLAFANGANDVGSIIMAAFAIWWIAAFYGDA